MNNKPLISILMPVFNAEKHLRDCIMSILSQEYENFEFLIINDGSTDNSHQIINSFSDERINYFKNDENRKLIYTLNKGISLCKGKYIARMDADDIALPSRLKIQSDFLEKNDKIDILGTNITTINEHNIETGERNYPTTNDEILYHLLFINCPIAHPTVMIRKKVFDEFNIYYNENYLHAEDYKLWVDLINKVQFHNCNEPLLLYREHGSQVTSKHQKTNKSLSSKIKSEVIKKSISNISEKELKSFINASNTKTSHFDYHEINELIKFYQKSKLYCQKEKLSIKTHNEFFSKLFTNQYFKLNNYNVNNLFILLKMKVLGIKINFSILNYLVFSIKCIFGLKNFSKNLK